MKAETHLEAAKAQRKGQTIKVVVWDLDNTLWKGVLLEDENVELDERVAHTIRELDKRGILNSVASKNNQDAAMARLEELGLAEYFLYPQINWNPKSASVRQIATSINIGLDAVAFVDDQPFEREEVAHELPDVLCIDTVDVAQILDMERMIPRFITGESAMRRKLYQADIQRGEAEAEFTGHNENFLATLDMTFEIKNCDEDDLQRAEELTQRTNQLNTTGYTYSYDELDVLRNSDDHLLLVTRLSDKYGTYGTIGLALVEQQESHWTIKLLLMSCRVMSRGVGTILMNHILKLAKKAGVTVRAEFLPNGRNRQMYITYKFANFKEIAKEGELVTLENDLTRIQPFPDYVNVDIRFEHEPVAG